MKATSLKEQNPVRMLLVGYPGSGKTGSIAALLEAGFKVRILDFEGNYDPLLAYASEDALSRLDIMPLHDPMRVNEKGVQVPAGIPTAFSSGLKAMQDWKTEDAEGKPISLGGSHTWGPDTIVVVDGLTSMKDAAFRRAMVMMNKQRGNITSAVWGAAVEDVQNALQTMASKSNRYHLIVIAHLQMIGPSDFINQNDEKSENEAVKDAKMEAIREGLIPTRLYPIATTKNQSQTIHKDFPAMVRAEKIIRMGKTVRVLRTGAGPELDLKFPAKDAPKEVPIETGMVDLFKALGAEPPKSRA